VAANGTSQNGIRINQDNTLHVTFQFTKPTEEHFLINSLKKLNKFDHIISSYNTIKLPVSRKIEAKNIS
jgi:hypothetical protein